MRTGSDLNKLTFVIVCAMGLPAFCVGHGVKHSVFSAGTGIEATYDNGRPMAFCDVVVVSPANPDNEYQSGITDPAGRFAFVPDTNGVWKVTVDDGMGHLVTADVQTGPNKQVSDGVDTGMNRFAGGMIGVSVIFGLFGLYSLVRFHPRRTGRASSPSEPRTTQKSMEKNSGGPTCTSPKA